MKWPGIPKGRPCHAGMAHVGLHGRPEWVGVAGAERIREKGNSVFVCVDRVCVLDGEDKCVLER